MTIPNLPTDNMYKFMAFLGVVIMIFSTWNFFSKCDEYYYNQIDLEFKMYELEYADKQYTQMYYNLKAAIDSSMNKLSQVQSPYDSIIRPPVDLVELVRQIHDPEYREIIIFLHDYGEMVYPQYKNYLEIQKRGIEFEKICDEMVALSFDVEKQKRLLKGAKQKINWLLKVSIVGYVIGVGLAYWGFKLWYLRIQKYQDQKLKNKAKIPHRRPTIRRVR